MARLPWLPSHPPQFPNTAAALSDPEGLLAAGGGLDPDWLLLAYRRGIFPWYEPDQPILWWSPNPRAVIVPEEVHIGRSLCRTVRREQWEVSVDRAFGAVVSACAEPRRAGAGTWITPEMARAYIAMHDLGYAHSLEVWNGAQLIGGIYGIALGRVFFGESMFSHATDASKVALVSLCGLLRTLDIALLDCQVESAHVTRMGAKLWHRLEFEDALAEHASPSLIQTWQARWLPLKNATLSHYDYFRR